MALRNGGKFISQLLFGQTRNIGVQSKQLPKVEEMDNLCKQWVQLGLDAMEVRASHEHILTSRGIHPLQIASTLMVNGAFCCMTYQVIQHTASRFKKKDIKKEDVRYGDETKIDQCKELVKKLTNDEIAELAEYCYRRLNQLEL